jgi:hypothetical protein
MHNQQILSESLPFLTWGIVAHLIADWLLQSAWQADNKTNLKHPAAWVHSGIHTALYFFIFQPYIAILIGLIHLGIDTRKPMNWWGRKINQTTHGDIALHIVIWRDQVMHILIIALAALLNTIILK